jgi:hypothetical protein
MKITFCLALSAGLFAGCATASTNPPGLESRLDQAQAAATSWHTDSKLLAMKFMAEYGPPDRIEADRLVWDSADPWSRIAVWNTQDREPTALGSESLEQTLRYNVPPDKRKALAAFSDRLVVSDDCQELSARGDSEALNFLAINLADEIIRGDRSPEDARGFYDRVYRLSQAGKSSPYTQGLLFSANRSVLPRASEERGDFLHTPLNIWEY